MFFCRHSSSVYHDSTYLVCQHTVLARLVSALQACVCVTHVRTTLVTALRISCLA